MTVKELIERLNKLTEEQKELSICIYDARYQCHPDISRISIEKKRDGNEVVVFEE